MAIRPVPGPKALGLQPSRLLALHTRPPDDGHEDTDYPSQAPLVKMRPGLRSAVTQLVYTTLRPRDSFPAGRGIPGRMTGTTFRSESAILTAPSRAEGPGSEPGAFGDVCRC
jgi:hypothetical protein